MKKTIIFKYPQIIVLRKFLDLKPIELPEDNTLITFPGMLVPVHLQRESQAIIYFETYKPEINTVKYEELFN